MRTLRVALRRNFVSIISNLKTINKKELRAVLIGYVGCSLFASARQRSG